MTGFHTATDTSPPAGGDQQQPYGRRRLGEVLVAAEVITEAQLAEALDRRLRDGEERERLGETIVRLGMATETDIARALATQLGLAYLEDEDLRQAQDTATKRLPPALATRHGVLPLQIGDDGTLVVATADPTNVVALDDVRAATGARRLRPVVAGSTALQAAVRTVYGFGQRAASELLADLEPAAEEPDPTEAELGAAAADAPVVRLADGILSGAIEADASDVHVEPGPQGAVVRYRVDGVLHARMTVPSSAVGALTSRLKLLSGMDIAERRRPQDGRVQLRRNGRTTDLRVSSLPSLHGETIVIRLLGTGEEPLGLAEVGLSHEQTARVRSAIESPHGLVLITGPTGSGKTSTLYGCLTHLTGDTRNIITLEDPVEYTLAGVNQTPINDRIGLTFAKALRSVLRQDPDVVMVGEVRDGETAELALQASLTGHLVFSTLHTNDAPGAIIRLADLGVADYLIASALTLVVAQRLVRVVCPTCAKPTPADPEALERLGLNAADVADARLQVGQGCTTCGKTGYKGRMGVFEVLAVDANTRRLIANGAGETALRQAARLSGLHTLREDALSKAFAGTTTLEEVLRVTPADSSDEGLCPTCAAAIEPDFSTCPWCATDLGPTHCATCERDLARGWKVCPRCATPTEGYQEAGAGSATMLRAAGAPPPQ